MNQRSYFSDPDVAIGAAVALALALTRKPKPQVFTEAQLARLHDAARREDWNRAIEARKAAKKAGKEQSELGG